MESSSLQAQTLTPPARLPAPPAALLPRRRPPLPGVWRRRPAGQGVGLPDQGVHPDARWPLPQHLHRLLPPRAAPHPHRLRGWHREAVAQVGVGVCVSVVWGLCFMWGKGLVGRGGGASLGPAVGHQPRHAPCLLVLAPMPVLPVIPVCLDVCLAACAAPACTAAPRTAWRTRSTTAWSGCGLWATSRAPTAWPWGELSMGRTQPSAELQPGGPATCASCPAPAPVPLPPVFCPCPPLPLTLPVASLPCFPLLPRLPSQLRRGVCDGEAGARGACGLHGRKRQDHLGQAQRSADGQREEPGRHGGGG